MSTRKDKGEIRLVAWRPRCETCRVLEILLQGHLHKEGIQEHPK